MKKAWEKWKVIAQKIGDFQAKIIFSLLYFILITPMGLISNFFGDFLRSKKFPIWEEFEDASSTKNKLESQ